MSSFSSLFESSKEYAEILSDVKRGRLPMGVLGVGQAPKAHVIHALCEDVGRRALIITADEASASKICGDLQTMGTNCLMYPARDFNYRPADSQSREYERKRIGVLGNIAQGQYSAVVCSVEAAMQLTVPEDVLIAKSALLKAGVSIPPQQVKQALVCAGYVRSDMVEGKGQFAGRGSIIDFFPPDSEQPVRVEFWGDDIDSMAYFDPVSQRRNDSVDEIKITPATEVIFDSDAEFASRIRQLAHSLRGKNAARVRESLLADADGLDSGVRVNCADRYLPIAYGEPQSIFDYCRDDMLFICETGSVKERAKSVRRLANEDIKAMFEDGVLCKGLDRFYLTDSDVISMYEKMGAVYLDNFARGSFDTPVKELVNMNVRQSSAWEGSLRVLLEDIRPDAARGYKFVILAGTQKAAQSLCEDLSDEGLSCICYPSMPLSFLSKSINIVAGALSGGIDYPSEKIKIITQSRYKTASSVRRPSERKRSSGAGSLHSIEELTRGDYVVHRIHGIGVFDGIVNIDSGGVSKDYIKVKYMGSDVLYVPVTQLDLVSKYIGPHEEGGKTLKLNRLGTKDWAKTKSKVRAAVKDMAKELLELYSKRHNTKGHEFSPDIDMQSDFERRFEFDETDDQLRCIHEIKSDMEKPYPMDRLLCGDVGFGKTEVALRAAFKCAADGMQCAILVPTTILAFQHYSTLLRRFEGFPINIDMLSRFRTAKETAQTIKRVKTGEVDILVGTHRIISKDVEFKNLGLVIIDEEQRFGVAQKEKLKNAFPTVDVLTLSATPIPRTLNMAMTGIRDMSVIEEAPLDRSPVQTYVLEHDMGVLSEAIRKELRRGGQVYYLHNRVENIEETAEEIRKFVPEARIGIAHGKMAENQLSEIWRQLLENEIDVLVCTTIIETGVDVPNCNTLIIDNADRLGLSQLHQIRGRVGRSSRRAFAYLTFNKGAQLSEIASKRLEAIREFTEFGSGFKIAMKDLEIRGAGSILGAQQHGHLEAVGYDMYLEMLSEAVEGEQNNEEVKEKKECLIDVRIDAHIPESYIGSVPQRLSAYRRIAEIRDSESARDVLDEFIDRYGDPPACVEGLVKIALIRNSAIKHGFYEIKQNGNNLLLYADTINMDDVKRLAFDMRGRVLVSAAAKPYISVKTAVGQTSVDALSEIFKILG